MIVIKLYSGINIKDLEILGEGTQGKVYKINGERCIKIFKSKKECQDEAKTLTMAQGERHFPKIYSYGEDYIIREYISGTELDEYLRTSKLTVQILNQLIELYEAMLRVGYTRLDAAIFHILVTPNTDLKLIDTAKSMTKETVIPNLLISGLEKLGFKDDLFNYLKSNRPDLYHMWKNYTKKDYKKIDKKKYKL